MKKSQKWKVLLRILCLLTPLLFLSPLVLSIGWHLTTGGHVKYGGRTVTVPYRWIRQPKRWSNVPSLSFTKLPIAVFFDATHGSMSFEQSAGFRTSSDQLRAWRHSLELVYHVPGDDLKGPIEVSQDSYCITAPLRSTGSGTAVTCYLFGGDWRASFMGNSKDVDEFFAVVRGIR